jgi:prevent-host-death family protein
MKMITLSALQTQCVAVVEEVATTGEAVTIVHHGHPVAQLVPSDVPPGPFPQEALRGTVHIHGDIEAPVLPPDSWEAEGPPRP